MFTYFVEGQFEFFKFLPTLFENPCLPCFDGIQTPQSLGITLHKMFVPQGIYLMQNLPPPY
jgi:hypothetical protein